MFEVGKQVMCINDDDFKMISPSPKLGEPYTIDMVINDGICECCNQPKMFLGFQGLYMTNVGGPVIWDSICFKLLDDIDIEEIIKEQLIEQI